MNLLRLGTNSRLFQRACIIMECLSMVTSTPGQAPSLVYAGPEPDTVGTDPWRPSK